MDNKKNHKDSIIKFTAVLVLILWCAYTVYTSEPSERFSTILIILFFWIIAN